MMRLNGDTSQPLYKQLVQEIKKDIETGRYPADSRLPSEQELVDSYLVSRITVRAALKELSEMGLVVRRQGKGTFVLARKMQRDLSHVNSFSAMCRNIGKEPGAKLLSAEIIDASPQDCETLELAEGSRIVCLRRLRYADGVPISIEEDHFPDRYAFLLNENLDDTSLVELLETKYHITFYDVHRTIELVYAHHDMARQLNCATNTPMMRIVSVGLEAGSQTPGERSIQYIIGENFKLYV